MAERTMTVRYIGLRERQKPDGKRFPASNVDGKGTSSADIFYNWANQIDSAQISDPRTNRIILVQQPRRFHDGGVLVGLKSGHYGESGDLVDATTMQAVSWIGDNMAPTAPHKTFFYAPPYGGYALFFSESSSRGSGGNRLLSAFVKYWNSNKALPLAKDYAVIDREGWLAQANAIKEIELRCFTKPGDKAEAAIENVGYYSYSVHPTRGKRLNRGWFERLGNRPELIYQVVGIDDRGAISKYESKIIVTLVGRDGREKQYVIGDYESGTPVRLVLNRHGEDVLTEDEFVQKCMEEADLILAEMGVQ